MHEPSHAMSSGASTRALPGRARFPPYRLTGEEKLLGGMAITEQVRHVTNGPQVPLIVKQLPGAIGCASAQHDLAGVVVLQTEEVITQPLILVTKINPND
jgi:hypothetical protein